MGTDIHFYVERRRSDGSWETCDQWEGDEYYEKCVSYDKQFYHERNYDLFAMLANVRNGYGVAGIETGAGFVPLAMPRGFPDDVCEEIKKYVEPYIEHTPTYCTLQELLEYDWTRETVKYGVMSIKEYLKWIPMHRDYCDTPTSYSGGISGPGIVIHKQDEIDCAVKHLDQWKIRRGDLNEEVSSVLNVPLTELTSADHYHARHFVSATWGITYARAARSFLVDTLPRLLRLGKPADVRCVFYFDS